jgi:hypothetical protein
VPWVYTPELAYTLEVMKIRAELAAQDQELDQDGVHALARARIGPPRRWVAREPELTPQGKAILERIAQDREQAQAHDLGYHRWPAAGPAGSRSSTLSTPSARSSHRPSFTLRPPKISGIRTASAARGRGGLVL